MLVLQLSHFIDRLGREGKDDGDDVLIVINEWSLANQEYLIVYGMGLQKKMVVLLGR